jgi:hypothetical protein
MATLSKTVLGRVSGSIGDITFRQKNGSNFLSTRPRSFTPGSDEASINRRGKFAFACKLAASMVSIDSIKSLWEDAAEAGKSAYNTIVGTNYKFIAANSITSQTFLTPGIGFSVKATSFTLSSTGLQVVFDAIGANAGIDLNTEKSIQLAAVISLSNRVDETVEKFYLLPLVSATQLLTVDTASTFSIPFSNQESQLYDKYNVRKVLYALVTLDAGGNVGPYSSTCCG